MMGQYRRMVDGCILIWRRFALLSYVRCNIIAGGKQVDRLVALYSPSYQLLRLWATPDCAGHEMYTSFLQTV